MTSPETCLAMDSKSPTGAGWLGWWVNTSVSGWAFVSKHSFKLVVLINIFIFNASPICVTLSVSISSGRARRLLSKIYWDVVVVDEAHKLKNHDSKFTTTLREEYSCRNSLLLTGTHTLFHVLKPLRDSDSSASPKYTALVSIHCLR